MKKLCSDRDLITLQMLKARLEDAGFEVELRGEFLQAVRGEVPFTSDTLPSLWVGDDKVFAAMAFLQKEEQLRADLPEWKCRRCGETNEGSFTDCWKCQTAKP